jgi:hypothetical protein
VSEINNTPANKHAEPIECSKVRKCGWKGMVSDLVPGGPVKWMAGAKKQVCPNCGNDTYYKRDIK